MSGPAKFHCQEVGDLGEGRSIVRTEWRERRKRLESIENHFQSIDQHVRWPSIVSITKVTQEYKPQLPAAPHQFVDLLRAVGWLRKAFVLTEQFQDLLTIHTLKEKREGDC